MITYFENGYMMMIDRTFNRIVVAHPGKENKSVFEFEESITTADERSIQKTVINLKTQD